MGMKISMNIAKFKAGLEATRENFRKANRPAAQAGAQIIYDRARAIAQDIRSERPHMFYGTHGVYGPYSPGNLLNSIYQAFSEDNSHADMATYHISWNKDKAPYGFMVELGTSTSKAQSFIGRAVAETRTQVREAMKARYIDEVSGKK